MTLASWPDSAVSCSPSGKPPETGIGMEMAGGPRAVHGEFILASPVDARPNGAGPVAAGTKMTGVALYNSATLALHSAMYLLASPYFASEILRPSRTRSARSSSREPYWL